MPISAPGSRPERIRLFPRGAARAFTLIELLVVMLVIAIAAGAISLALRDGAAMKLEEEGARLASLLESARAESRAAGMVVRWVPARGEEGASADSGAAFRFVGLPGDVKLPDHWLEPRVAAQIVGSTALLLGPDAILPPQRVVLRLDDRRIEIATDGLSPFSVKSAPEER
jgi:general secretion pathway protein H